MRHREREDRLHIVNREYHNGHDAEILAAAVAGLVGTLKHILEDRPAIAVRELNKPMMEKAAFATIQGFIVAHSRLCAETGDPWTMFKLPEAGPSFLD